MQCYNFWATLFLLHAATCSTPVSILPLVRAGGVGTVSVSDSSTVGQR